MTFCISPLRIGISNVISHKPGATRVAFLNHPRQQLRAISQGVSYPRHEFFATASRAQRLAREDATTSKDDTIQPVAEASSRCTTTTRQSLSSLLPAHQYHDSLTSYLAFARRSALNPTRHTYLGTRYEYLTQATLPRLGFELIRTGKSGDKGVDLAGRWHLPSTSHGRQSEPDVGGEYMRVVVQCKRIVGKRKLSPNAVREMDGAFLGGPPGWRGDNVVGVIVSTKPATKGVISALQASKRGLVWVCLEEFEEGGGEDAGLDEESESAVEDEVEESDVGEGEDEAAPIQHTYGLVGGRVVQLLYNGAAQRMGLEGLDVVKRHDQQEDNSTTPGDAIVLVYRGRPVPGYLTSDN